MLNDVFVIIVTDRAEVSMALCSLKKAARRNWTDWKLVGPNGLEPLTSTVSR